MSIFLPGMKCGICGNRIEDNAEITSFPPFVSNAVDPLIIFNDAPLHAICFKKHPLSSKAEKVMDDLNTMSCQGKICCICKQEIINPDEYICTGYLSSDNDKLASYNYKQYDKNCFFDSDDAKHILALIEEKKDMGLWKNDNIINYIRSR